MPLDRAGVVSWYQRNRERSRALFDVVDPGAYYKRPIALRQPIVFYDGHLPAFSFNTLVKKALGRPGIDVRLEALFARGIDPDVSRESPVTSHDEWPSRETVRVFVDEADRQVVDALMNDALLDRAEAVFTILEHEAMHQETLLYMWHRLPIADKRRPIGYRPRVEGASPRQAWIEVPGGCATLGVDRGSIPFGWDNEFPHATANVAPFAIDRFDVTNEQFLSFVEAGGYARKDVWRPEDWQWRNAERVEHPAFWQRDGGAWLWRGMFDRIPLPMSWPAYVSCAEALAFARWRGARLPTEAEFQRAAFGSPDGEHRHPWGSAEPSAAHGVFDFASWDPEPSGSHPKGASAWGVEDLVGNGWEWTSTPFAPFAGFRAMASYPEYSADFFDGEHVVMKGASPATARELLRPTFRNWFRPRYPYVYATFRCVRDADPRP